MTLNYNEIVSWWWPLALVETFQYKYSNVICYLMSIVDSNVHTWNEYSNNSFFIFCLQMSSLPTYPPHPCLKWREGWENSQPSSTHSFIVGTWISNPFLLPLKKRKIDQYSHKFEKNRYFWKKRGSCSERSYTWITSWIWIIFSPMWHTTSLLS